MWQKIWCVDFTKNFIKDKNIISILARILALCAMLEMANADSKSLQNLQHTQAPQESTQEIKPNEEIKHQDIKHLTQDFGKLDTYFSKKYVSAFSASAHFFPALGLGYALIIKDFIGLRQQAMGWVVVVGATYVIKYGLYFAAPYVPNALNFAKRPKENSYEAFPSGHTSSAFAMAGFAFKRYGAKLGIPAFILASAIGESRIILEKHTILQVVCGGILGFLLSFFCASPFKRKREPNIVPNLPNYKQHNQTLVGLLALFLL